MIGRHHRVPSRPMWQRICQLPGPVFQAKVPRLRQLSNECAMRLLAGFVSVAFVAMLSGCTYEQYGPPEWYFQHMKAEPPRGDTVSVCHAYGCKMQTKVRLSARDIDAIRDLMTSIRRDDTAAEERRAIAYAVAWIERAVGDRIGTSTDRAGMEYGGSGDPTQQDCVDEATNTTAYLLVLQSNGLLTHHTVGTPLAKDALWRGVEGWPHFTAVLKETATGQHWAVDSWIYANGENPAVVETEKWYIEDLNSLPSSTI
jgi:hypothetical protein